MAPLSPLLKDIEISKDVPLSFAFYIVCGSLFPSSHRENGSLSLKLMCMLKKSEGVSRLEGCQSNLNRESFLMVRPSPPRSPLVQRNTLAHYFLRIHLNGNTVRSVMVWPGGFNAVFPDA